MRHSSLSIYSQLTANHRYSQEVDLHLDHILVSAEEEPNAQDTARWASWFATRPRQRLHRRNSSGIGGYNLHPNSHARLKECGQRGDARAARRQRPQRLGYPSGGDSYEHGGGPAANLSILTQTLRKERQKIDN